MIWHSARHTQLAEYDEYAIETCVLIDHPRMRGHDLAADQASVHGTPAHVCDKLIAPQPHYPVHNVCMHRPTVFCAARALYGRSI